MFSSSLKARLLSNLPLPGRWRDQFELEPQQARKAIQDVVEGTIKPRDVSRVVRLAEAGDLKIDIETAHPLLMGLIPRTERGGASVLAKGLNQLLAYPKLDPQVPKLCHDMLMDRVRKRSIPRDEKKGLVEQTTRTVAGLLEHPATPTKLLDDLVEEIIREGKALHPEVNTPLVNNYCRLWEEPDLRVHSDIRAAMRKQAQRDASLEIWELLAEDQLDDQKLCLKKIGEASPMRLETWLKEHPESWNRDVVEKLLQDDNPGVRRAVLRQSGRVKRGR